MGILKTPYLSKNKIHCDDQTKECDHTETPTKPSRPEPVLDFPQPELYALELDRGGGGGGNNGGGGKNESFVLAGERLPHDMAGVVALKGDLGGTSGGNAAILGSETTDAIESMLLDVGAGEGGVVRSTSCVPVQCSVKPP